MKLKRIYEKVIYIIVFLFLLLTQVLKASEYSYQANACNNYQFSGSLLSIKNTITRDCTIQFKKIDNKIKVIDSTYQQIDHNHKIVLKLIMSDLSIVNFKVALLVQDQCIQLYKSCSKTCKENSISGFICKDLKCLCE